MLNSVGFTMLVRKKPNRHLSKLSSEEFPALTKHTKYKKVVSKNNAWTHPLNKDLIKKNKPDPQKNTFASLRRIHRETDSQYFDRLLNLYTQTTKLKQYNIYILKHGKRTIKVAARDEIIARFICQWHDYKTAINEEKTELEIKKKEMWNDMQEDDQLYNEIVEYMNENNYGIDDVLGEYCNTNTNKKFSYIWFNFNKTSCKKTDELCISKERILL